MNLGDWLADIGLSASQLAQSATAWREFATLGTTIKTWNEFQRVIAATQSGLSRAAVGELWSMARYWRDPSQYLRQLDPSVELPVNFMPIVPRRPSEALGESNYRYTVGITITTPDPNNPAPEYAHRHTMFVDVDSPTPLPNWDAIQQAEDILQLRLPVDKYKTGEGQDWYDFYRPQSYIHGVYRLKG